MKNKTTKKQVANAKISVKNKTLEPSTVSQLAERLTAVKVQNLNKSGSLDKYLAYILPLLVVVVIFGLVWSWYRARTVVKPDISTEGVVIENLSPAEAERVLKGAGDFHTLSMTASSASVSGMAKMRWEVVNSKINLSVIADLGEPVVNESYQVWLQRVGDEKPSFASVLNFGKSGWTTSFALSVSDLPLQVSIVHQSESQVGTTGFEVLFVGQIES